MLKKLFTAIDKMDAAKFAEFLSEDAIFKFGSQPEVKGRQNIEKYVAGFFSTIKKLEHNVIKSFVDKNTHVCEGFVTYTRHDGKIVTIPFANILEMSADKISGYKIYIDPTPLFS